MSGQEKGERALLRGDQWPTRSYLAKLGASVIVDSVVWEDDESLMVKKYFLLTCMISVLSQKKLSNGDLSADLKVRFILEDLAMVN